MVIQFINCNLGNYEQVKSKKKFIALHYTGNRNDTARSNARYFHNTVTKTSAHYFVDENEIYQSVPDFYKAWAIGSYTNEYYHPKARNVNTINIEMCNSVDGIPEKTKQNTFWLIKLLMERYNIPIENVIRHYDVTHKLCPKPLVSEIAWSKFKQELKLYLSKGETTMTVEEAKKILIEKVGLSKTTIDWLSYYKYSDSLFIKLAQNVK